jgi:transcription elongation factor GreB
VVDPALQKNHAQVFFGATVTYIDQHDAEKTITIVGVDEADMDGGLVSWISPVAKALLKARVGDSVKVRTPAGEESIEVLEIRYAGAQQQ